MRKGVKKKAGKQSVKSAKKKSVQKPVQTVQKIIKPVQKAHWTAEYFLSPQHPLTVKVLGCGGSGSQMLQALARINVSLLALGHPGLLVQAWDADRVTEANLGRQLFSRADLDQYKAKVLIERLNRFYGFNWQAVPLRWDGESLKSSLFANIMITCVDNVSTRETVHKIRAGSSRRSEPFNIPVYWLDLGNTQTSGQVVLGTFGLIKQPKRTRHTAGSLPTIIDLFPNLQKFEKPDAPSCSLAEALSKQDLFINSTLAQFGATLLWKLFRELHIKQHGCFLNLSTMSVNPISVN